MKYLTYYIPDSKHIEELRQRIDDDECRCRTTAIHDDDMMMIVLFYKFVNDDDDVDEKKVVLDIGQ